MTTPRSTRRRDALVVVGIVALTVVVQLPLLAGGTVVGMDAATQFLPWYGWLGEQLRSGRLPLWNPHVFAGTPALADPLSGWGYLPAMLAFTALPLPVATPVFLVVQLALAGGGAYLLARALGMRVGAALVAAVAYEFTGFAVLRNPCCFAFVSVEAWLPFVLLGVERAVKALSWRGRLRWWWLAGLALSQVLAGWLGQGSLYVLVATGAWVCWLTVVSPAAAAGPPRWRERLGALALHGGGVLLAGFALAAAALLPRLRFNAVSNLAGGYPGSASGGGWTPAEWLLLVTPGDWYVGVAALALAVAAPFVARQRHATPFLAGLAVAPLVLAMPARTPLHLLLFAIPGAARLHPHGPQRVLLLLYLAVALLAGATVNALPRPRRLPASAVAVAALALVGADLLVANRLGVAEATAATLGSRRLVAVDLATWYKPSAALRFLRASGSGNGGGRYVAYAPEVRNGRATTTAYSVRWTEPLIAAIGANNRAMLAGVATTQGYNPTHIARYDALVHALNGSGPRQDYHFADVRPSGLDSPLLDLLGVRWLLVPAAVDGPDAADIRRLTDTLPTAFSGGGVRVLANPEALPRAWLVHDARRVAPGEALPLLASRAVNPRVTALLESDPPPLGRPQRRSSVDIVTHDADRITVETDSDADALLVLSEIAYPDWRATVDGRPAETVVADHALRGVAVPAGRHRVELAYDSRALDAGLAVTGVAIASGLALLPSWGRNPDRGRRPLRSRR